MARHRNPIPTYREKNGHGVITVRDAGGNRREILLPGAYDSDESRAEYERQLAILRANRGSLPPNRESPADPSIAELILKYIEQHVDNYYQGHERENRTPAPLTTADNLLITLLAERDALWTPQRRFSGCHANTNVAAGRRAYREEGGMRWEPGGRTSSARRDALEQLAEGGMVTKSKKGRSIVVKLTNRGEVRAQYLAATASIIDQFAWDVFRAVLHRDGWTPEDDLRNVWRVALNPHGEWTREAELSAIAECLFPHLCREWVVSGSTVRGNARYCASPSSISAARPNVPAPLIDDATAAAGYAVYRRSFESAYFALASVQPEDDSDIGEIPLAASATSEAEATAWERSAELAAQGL